MTEVKDTIKKAKYALDEQIKFIKLLKKKLNSPIVSESILATWTACMLETYIREQLIEDVKMAMDMHIKNKQN